MSASQEHGDFERKLQLIPLLPLCAAGFVGNLAMLLPVGLLPAMSADLHVSESAMGQTLTASAIGTLLTAAPLTRATAGWRRKQLLLVAVAVVVAANTLTVLSNGFLLIIASRLLAGGAFGVAWPVLAGYARRIAPAHLQGQAIAVALAGIPLSGVLGVPLSALLGKALGWQAAFITTSVLGAAIILWIAALVPQHPGRRPELRTHMWRALSMPGVAPVLWVTLLFVLGTAILYGYITAVLAHNHMAESAGLVLLVLGGSQVPGIWVAGVFVDHSLRGLTIASMLLVAGAATLLVTTTGHPVIVYTAVTLWGLGCGGIPTLLQTAVGEAGADQADAAQAMLVTVWNIANAGAGGIGGLLLDTLGVSSLTYCVLFLLTSAVSTVTAAHVHGFPAKQPNAL